MSTHRGEQSSVKATLESVLHRFDPGRVGVRALAVLAGVITLIAAVVAWRARPHPQPVAAPTAMVASAAPVVERTATTIVVAVSGRVRDPGLVRLPPGARVADAIAAAGGVVPGTDISFVNLARKVTDGELIVIGLPAASAMAGGGAVGDSSGVVNLNTATSAQLQTLPGVGPVLADRIIEYREAHGGFATVADLRKVSGIADTKFSELRDRVTV